MPTCKNSPTTRPRHSSRHLHTRRTPIWITTRSGYSFQRGEPEALQAALQADPALANQTIHWTLNQENQSDPLHYVSDCVFHEWLTNGTEAEIAALLLKHGAAINGTAGRETPLIGSASLGTQSIAKLLIEAGADLEATSVFGARAIHWAAWLGSAQTVDQLISHGAAIEVTCSQYNATPLIWAVHGYGPHGPKKKRSSRGRTLTHPSRRSLQALNKHGQTLLELAKQCVNTDMYDLLSHSAATTQRL